MLRKTKYMNLPCKEDKCILRPACISKMEIRCNALWFYFRYLEKIACIDTVAAWEFIQVYFPMLHSINTNEAKE